MRKPKTEAIKKKARNDTSYKGKGVEKKKKVATGRKLVERTRNGGKWTEAMFWQNIRSALRNKSRWWYPRTKCLEDHRRPNESRNKRLKWEFYCDVCKGWFPQTQVEAHHSQPAGQLNCYDDIAPFVKNLFAETGWMCVCKKCHLEIHSKK